MWYFSSCAAPGAVVHSHMSNYTLHRYYICVGIVEFRTYMTSKIMMAWRRLQSMGWHDYYADMGPKICTSKNRYAVQTQHTRLQTGIPVTLTPVLKALRGRIWTLRNATDAMSDKDHFYQLFSCAPVRLLPHEMSNRMHKVTCRRAVWVCWYAHDYSVWQTKSNKQGCSSCPEAACMIESRGGMMMGFLTSTCESLK